MDDEEICGACTAILCCGMVTDEHVYRTQVLRVMCFINGILEAAAEEEPE